MKKTKKKTIKIKESSPLKYHGEVTVQKIYSGKVVSSVKEKNAGFAPLFKFILLCLAGQYDEKLLPLFVIPVNIDTDTNKITYADTDINLIASREVISKENDNYLEYKFYLPFKESYKTIGFNALALYSLKHEPQKISIGSDAEPYYSMIVNFKDQQKSEKEDILIIWQLFIDNKE